MTVSVKIDGVAELKSKFSQIPLNLSGKVLAAGPRAAAALVKRVTQQNIASQGLVDTGTMRRAVYSGIHKRESNPFRQVAIVGVRRGKRLRKKGLDAYYWAFHEFGTSKLPAKPFLRPAFFSTTNKQIEVMQRRLRVAMERAVAKHGLKFK